MKISLLTIAIAGLSATGVNSHGTEVRACITGAGNLRFYIEHWHRDLSSATRAGTMDIIPNHISGASKQTLSPNGFINNVAPGNLPGCANGQAPALVTTCSQTRDDWVYYDFPTTCNNPVSYTLLSGNTVYLTEGCSNLYPATYQDTFTDQTPPTITVDGQTCNGYTITQTLQSCKAVPVSFIVAATDDCDSNPSLSVSTASGSIFPPGTTPVTATSSDASGKSTTCTFSVNVVLPANCGGAYGDPHIKTWAGEMYDFHGVCDLVLVHNPAFRGGLGMDIHLRTKRTRQWSYVESAAIRIGKDTLEVTGGQKQIGYWVNGLQGNQLPHDMELSQGIAGLPITFRKSSEKSHQFIVDLGSNEDIVFSTWNGYVRVDFHVRDGTNFGSSIGLMGTYPAGIKVARDNSTVIVDTDVFGQEWQVLPEEPKLFHNTEGPQAPDRCEIPSTAEMRRRLAVSSITIEEARTACSRVSEEDFEVCVFDVMATNDKDIAGAY